MADLIYAMPVVGKLRDVERVVVLAAFAITMLSALGLQRLIDGPEAPRVRPSQRSLLLVAIVIMLVPFGIVLLARQPAIQAALEIQPQLLTESRAAASRTPMCR